MILIELPAYIIKLYGPDGDWMFITNRNEKYVPALKGTGVCMLDDHTSPLRIASHFPLLSNRLFRKACKQFPFLFCADFNHCDSPKASIIIGHRGKEKLKNLHCVLQSVAAQTIRATECIVVEQSASAELKNQLPAWVRYYHQQVKDTDLYNRSLAFNLGAEKANSENLIFHDNDLVIPACYVESHLKYFSLGYELVNLKRFIFGLGRADTNLLSSQHSINIAFSPKYVLQNAKGGGSLAITKSAYRRIGGFDNRFSGWGGEDNELWQRAQVLNIYPFTNLPMVHLWHKPQADKRGGRHGGGFYTEELFDELSKIPIYDRIKHLTALQSW